MVTQFHKYTINTIRECKFYLKALKKQIIIKAS